MNTGISIMISFVVGGMLLVSIITMNASVIENSGETVLNMSAKSTVETISTIMTRDMLRIGYNTGEIPYESITTAISNPDSRTHQKIAFSADIDNDDTQSPIKITWEALPNQPITNTTTNKNDYELKRIVASGPEQGTTIFAVTDFTFKFLDENGNITATNSKIKSIRITMVCEAPTKYGQKANFEKSVWDKTFTPPNLNLENY